MSAPFFRISNLHNATVHSLSLNVHLDILKLLKYRPEDGYNTCRERPLLRSSSTGLEARLCVGGRKGYSMSGKAIAEVLKVQAWMSKTMRVTPCAFGSKMILFLSPKNKWRAI